jgi:hypothetical protein
VNRRTLLLAMACGACQGPRASDAGPYRWEELTPRAAFPPGYNFQVFVARDGRFVALHPEGTHESRDGATWIASALPFSGLNSAYLAYVEHKGAVFALGRHQGNYENFMLDPVIQRTSDFVVWEQAGRSDTLPPLFFYGAASFAGFIWIVGGHDGQTENAAIWRSADGPSWECVVEAAPFGPRCRVNVTVFDGRLWMLGGGVLDGEIRGDVWSSPDGLDWRKETDAISDPLATGFTPISFDGQLWLLGANRGGGFSSNSLVSRDGRAWEAVDAPWSPRGGIGAWVHDGSLYVTGGKYSRPGPGGDLEFIYSNDVWRMTPVA